MSEPQFRRMRQQLFGSEVVVSIPNNAKRVGEKEIRELVSNNKKEIRSLNSPIILKRETDEGVVSKFVLGDARKMMNRPDYFAKFNEMIHRCGSVSDVVAM